MVTFDTSYKDKSVNKYLRVGKINNKPYTYPNPTFVVLHETANGSGNAHQTLRYNLDGSPESSYHFLIARDGTIYLYIDPFKYISYHAGVNSFINGLKGWEINVHSIGIELDGPNNGKPVTNAQRIALKELADYLYDNFDIIISPDNYVTHATVAPKDSNNRVYKTDPRGLTKDDIVKLGLLFMGKPTISRNQFKSIMQSVNSPMENDSDTIYELFIKEGIDPNVALAIAYHENRLGTLGVVKEHDLKNWGCVRTPYQVKAEIVSTPKGQFVKYTSWVEGVIDWIQRIKNKYIAHNMPTVETAIPIYAPSSDGNDSKQYIRVIRKLVKTWAIVNPVIPNPSGADQIVPLVIRDYWVNSGGVWQPDQYALGYLLGQKIEPNQTIFQFERGHIRLTNEGTISALLLTEIIQDE